MTSTRVKVALGATIPGAEQFSSLRIELASESDVTENGDEAALRASMIQQLSKELAEWKASKSNSVRSSDNQKAIRSDDPYAPLQFWKQSIKNPNLSTIPVTDETLTNAVVHDLYDKLKLAGGRMKVDRTSYRLSTFNGREFLQRWSSGKIG